MGKWLTSATSCAPAPATRMATACPPLPSTKPARTQRMPRATSPSSTLALTCLVAWRFVGRALPRPLHRPAVRRSAHRIHQLADQSGCYSGHQLLPRRHRHESRSLLLSPQSSVTVADSIPIALALGFLVAPTMAWQGARTAVGRASARTHSCLAPLKAVR